METLGKVLGTALEIVELLMEAAVSIMTRLVLWVFVVAWFSPWLAILLLIALVAGTVLKQMELGELQLGADLALAVLAWISINGLFGDMRITAGLVGGIFVYIVINEYL